MLSEGRKDLILRSAKSFDIADQFKAQFYSLGKEFTFTPDIALNLTVI